jgi:8-oxo-dGTP pyrophosphatase MutT (NUDIX family)
VKSFRPLGWRRLGRGRFLSFERSYHVAGDGRWTARDLVRHPGSAVAVPWDGERVYLISQFRAPVGKAVLELPAGKLDVAGEPPEITAARECAEELGLRPGKLTLLHRCYSSPGYTDEISWVYLAEDLEEVPAEPQGVEEVASSKVSMTLEEAIEAVEAGTIEDAKTILGLYALRSRL